MTDSQIAREEIARLVAENERLRSDCVILLANLDHLEECTGEGPEGEDRIIVEQIRVGLFGAPTDATAASYCESLIAVHAERVALDRAQRGAR